MLKCVHSIHRCQGSQNRLFLQLTSLPTKRFFQSSSVNTKDPVLTELVYGRKRIYTSLQTIGKSKSATSSRPCISSPMRWEWIQPAEDSKETKKEWYQIRQKKGGFSVVNSVKQNMREMFLPVGYPEAMHRCYKKFHYWLFLETYVGSAVCN